MIAEHAGAQAQVTLEPFDVLVQHNHRPLGLPKSDK